MYFHAKMNGSDIECYSSSGSGEMGVADTGLPVSKPSPNWLEPKRNLLLALEYLIPVRH